MQRLWRKLLHAGVDDADTHVADKAYFITVYSLIGLSAFMIFGMQYIASGEKVHVGYLEIAFGAGCLLNLLLLQLTKNVLAACNVFMAIIFGFLLLMLVR